MCNTLLLLLLLSLLLLLLLLHYKIKSVAYSSQGSHIRQLDF